MDRLPSELVRYLYLFLPSKCTKNLRLACKSFAEIGESHLFDDFEFRLYPQLSRLEQLKQLSLHPTIAPRLKCLCYETGIQLEYADYEYWKAQVYQAEVNQFSSEFTAVGQAKEEYEKFHQALEARFTPDLGERYEQYRQWLDHQAWIMAHSPEVASVFTAALGKCYELTRIKILMSKPQISFDDLMVYAAQDHARDATHNLRRAVRIGQRRTNCLNHIMSLLKAVNASKRHIKELVAIDLPETVLKITESDANILAGVFYPLEHLDLMIGDFPLSDWISRAVDITYFRGRSIAAISLRLLLNGVKDLQRLFLCFPNDRQAEFSFEIFYRTDADRFQRRWLAGLRELGLSNFNCTWSNLKDLLEDARALKSLSLSEATMETGSMISLVKTLRRLKLEEVCIDGWWKVEEDGGVWHSHWHENYSYPECGHFENGSTGNSLRSRIHSYIISGGPCPLEDWVEGGQLEKVWALAGDRSWHYLPED